MSRIGDVVMTSVGPSRVVTPLPEQRQVGAERVQAALVQPLGRTETNGAEAAQRFRLRDKEGNGGNGQSSAERQRLRDLQAADRAVRAEEKAHSAAAGAWGSPPEYDLVRGPDGRFYAVAGKVSVATTDAATPEQAAQAAGRLAAAARSVSSPSSADFAAAAGFSRQQAYAIAAQAYTPPSAARDARGGLIDISG